MVQRIEFEGTIHEFPNDFTYTDIQKALTSLSAPKPQHLAPAAQKEQFGYLDSLGAGLTKSVYGIADAMKISGSRGLYDKALKRAEESAKQNRLMTGLGEAGPAVLGAIGATASLPATAPLAAAMGVSGLAMGGLSGLARYPEVERLTGGNKDAALKAALARGATMTVAGAAPVSAAGGLLLRGATGGAIGLGTSQLDVAGQNMVLADKYPHLKESYLDPVGAGIDTAVGAVMGAALGPRVRIGLRSPKSDKGEPVLPPSASEATAIQLQQLTKQRESITAWMTDHNKRIAEAQSLPLTPRVQKYLDVLDDQKKNAEIELNDVDSRLKKVQADEGNTPKAPPEAPPRTSEVVANKVKELKAKQQDAANMHRANERAGRTGEQQTNLYAEVLAMSKQLKALEKEAIALRRAEEAAAARIPQGEEAKLAESGLNETVPRRPMDVEKVPDESKLTEEDLTASRDVEDQYTGQQGGQSNRAPWEPGKTPEEVRGNYSLMFKSGEFGRMSERALQGAIDFKKNKIKRWQERLDDLLEEGRLGKIPDLLYFQKEVTRFEKVISFMQEELAGMQAIHAERKAGGTGPANVPKPHITAGTLHGHSILPGLGDAVRTGGYRGGLSHIIENTKPDNNLHIVAKALLDNKFLNPLTELINSVDYPGWSGFYMPGSNRVSIVDQYRNASSTFVHESVHRATYNALNRFEVDPKSLTRVEFEAAKAIHRLYDEFKKRGWTGDVMNDVHEFTAYGLTENSTSILLKEANISSKDRFSTGKTISNLLKTLRGKILKLIGIDGKALTAYEELLNATKALIKNAEAADTSLSVHMYPSKIVNHMKRAYNLFDTPTYRNITQDQLVRELMHTSVEDISGGWATILLKNTIGVQQLRSIFDNKVIGFVNNVKYRAEQHGIRMKQIAKSGMDMSANTNMGKRFQSLQHYVDKGSLTALVHKLTDIEGYQMAKWGQRFFDEALDNDAALNLMRAEGASQKLINVVKARLESDLYLHTEKNKIRADMGQKPITYRPGWFGAVRKGKYAVRVMHNDLLFHVELFRSELEAQGLIRSIKEKSPHFEANLVDLEKIKEDTPAMKDMMPFVEHMFASVGVDPHASGLYAAFDKMTSTGLKFGKHAEYRQNLTGYAGSQWFKTPAEQGAAYKRAIFDSIDEQVATLTKQSIQAQTNRLLELEPSINSRNDIAMGRHIRDMATNSVPQWGWAKSFDNGIRKTADNLAHNLVKMFGKDDYYPRINPIDHILGVGSTIMYLSTLTRRPGFWVSQLLTSPSAIRLLLRDESVSVMDTMKNFTKGTFQAMGTIRSESWPGTLQALRDSETLHPSMQNELNKIDFLSPDATEKFAKIARWLTGQAPAEMADSFSRLWTASFMHEHFSAKGLKGRDLHEAVMHATDETMVMYNRSNKAAWVHKAGLFGQAANPLLTFGTAQMGNLIADINYMARKKTLRSSLPLISTFLTTQLMAGAIGLPILIEYEFLRGLLVSYDEGLADYLPSITEMMLDKPAALTYGVPSAVTGFDIGSGMRWNPMLNKFLLEDRQSIVEIFPAVAFMGVAGKTLGAVMGQAVGTDTVTAERRKAMLNLPVVGLNALTDELYFRAGERSMVPGGERGHGVVEQTPMERISTVIGSSTLKKKKAQATDYYKSQDEERTRNKQRKAIDMVTDAILEDNNRKLENSINILAEMGLTGKEVNNLVREQMEKRNTTLRDRWIKKGGDAAMRSNKAFLEKFGKVYEDLGD